MVLPTNISTLYAKVLITYLSDYIIRLYIVRHRPRLGTAKELNVRLEPQVRLTSINVRLSPIVSRAISIKRTNRLSSINIVVRRIKSLLTSPYDPASNFFFARRGSRAPRHEAIIKPINWQREGRRQESFHNTRKAREVVAGRPAGASTGG